MVSKQPAMSSEPDAQRRLREVVPRMAEAMHAFARDVQLTNDELMAVLEFLKDVSDADELVLLSDVLGISQLVDDQTHARDHGSANNVPGPFYIPDSPSIDNPGSLIPEGVMGDRIDVVGRVTDRSGAPIVDAVVDVWHADVRGRYSNEDPDGPPWAFRGPQQVGPEGGYAVATIRPRHYTVKHDGPVGRLLTALGRHPWRPAHIHFLVTAPGHRRFLAQAYLAGGPYLDDDAISGVKESLIVPVESGKLRFDITLAPA
jgi:hydroxyquinol 1,2-dioxygenase